MSAHCLWLKLIVKLVVLLMMGMSMNTEAGWFGLGGTSWKEEALLHDGQKIIVERNVERGGRHEIGQQPPIKNQRLSFILPSTQQSVTWEDSFTEDVGSANFLPNLLEVRQDSAYLVAIPMGCLSYNKWGRPNPPYVVFKYQHQQWARIPLQDLPSDIITPNLIPSSPDDEAKKWGQRIVPAEAIRRMYDGYRQAEYKTILREAVRGERGITSCEELVFYKGAWVGSGDSIGKRMMDNKAQMMDKKAK